MNAAPVMAVDWDAPSRVHAAVTTRLPPGASMAPFDAFNLGTRCGDDARAVAANRRALVRMLNLPADPCWLHQVHGADVARMGMQDSLAAAPPAADAAITASPGVVLAVLTADCLPLLVCADDGSEIAAIHAGWRGLAAGVIERSIRALRTPPARLLAWLGPAIGAPSYEIGADVRDAFLAHDARSAIAFSATRPGHWHCDLYALARQRLSALGLARISGGHIDTFADPRFYSYRRDRQTGRFASLIWMGR